MAKQYSVTVKVNGGSSAEHDVLIKDNETQYEAAFYFRVWKAFSMADGDNFEITESTGPTTVSNPMSWDTVPNDLIAIINTGRQISLAFINAG